MRHLNVILFSAALLFGMAGAARAQEEVRVEKVILAFTKPDDMVRLISQKVGVPKALEGILGYPLDNSLLVRGKPSAISALKDAVAIGDIVVGFDTAEFRTAKLTFRKAKPEQAQTVREVILKLNGAGSASIEDSRISVRGSEKWVTEAIAAAMRAEMLASGIDLAPPSPPNEFSAVKPHVEAAAPWITITVPAGINVMVQADKADYNASKGEALFTGSPKLKAGGLELQVRGQLRLLGGKKGEQAIVQLLIPEDSVRLILPYSEKLVVQATRVNYNSGIPALEITGALKLQLPNGLTVEVREGKAVSTALRKGEPVEITVTARGD
jgi:hypothetical protein